MRLKDWLGEKHIRDAFDPYRPMNTTIAIIQGAEITLCTEPTLGTEIVSFTADMDVDCDGSGGNPHHDPCFQPDTRLHLDGKALHAETVPYVVVPPVVLMKTKGKVLGSLCKCRNSKRPDLGWVDAVVGDSGPSRKIGEGSPALCEALGLDPNPNYGGTSDQIIDYVIHVGVPAQINGVQYNLQSA
jgi:Fungal chitosanase of glycosyl hydrolase group 75